MNVNYYTKTKDHNINDVGVIDKRTNESRSTNYKEKKQSSTTQVGEKRLSGDRRARRRLIIELLTFDEWLKVFAIGVFMFCLVAYWIEGR